MNKYEIIVYWSDEDASYVAEVPELPGCVAHGPTQDAALGSAQEATLGGNGARIRDPIPEPKGCFRR